MNSAPISTTAPFGSRSDHTRPPTRERASSTTTSDAAAGELVGRHEPGEARTDDDRPHGPVPGATATASTATAPCSCTSTGFSSSSSSPLGEQEIAGCRGQPGGGAPRQAPGGRGRR